MQSISLDVVLAGGKTEKVVCTAADFVAFETHFDKPVSVLEQGRLTYLYWLAWHGLKRVGKTDVEFEKFVESVEALEVPEGEQEAPVPLESNQLTG